MTYEEANEVLFPFIKDAPCINDFSISDRTLNSNDFTIKVMEMEVTNKIINVLYSRRTKIEFSDEASWLNEAGSFEIFLSFV